MIAESLEHPPKDQLIAFGQGKLANEESSQVEQHLEVCRECCETLLDLKDDTFVGLVRIAKPQDQRGHEEQTDGHIADSSEPAATLLGSADATLQTDELPAELCEHPRYRIVEMIGQGGMGVVYRAEHRLMNRFVAIKLINAQLVQHPQAVERFRREVQAAAKLSHANIVTAHDAEQAGNAHFLVMEFVEGTDLASVVRQRGPMSVTTACDCIRQAAAGLQHAHERGMVHRDIKPHNLMISPDGQVRILDFGLANFASEIALIEAEAEASDVKTDSARHLTTFGSVMGTPDYIAPEQARDAHAADIRADIYSLGCTLYYLLTGKPPFDGKTAIDKLKAHVEQAPTSLDQLRPDVPRELSVVVARMMAKNPAKRFQTPADVVAALAQFTQVTSAPRRMGRIVAAASLFAVALLAAVVIYVQTDKGAFVIEAADEVAVQIDKLGLTIRDTETGREYRLKPGKHPIRSGQYQIDVTELPSGLELSTDKFRLTRGGEERVTVRLKPKSENAGATVSDERRLQGKWVSLSGHSRGQPLTVEQLAQLSITFDGERVEIVSHTGPPTPQAATFTLNPNRDPKQIDFVAPGKQESMPGIYQFEGDRLKLALIDQDYSRPANFDPDHRPDHLTVVLERVPVAAALGQEESKVLKAAEAYLAVADEGNFDKLYDM
ncbi:MAG TPA: protein kinase, partial [Planctomycetaceae bacterium]|nr:protein kinase [Planctomycetaceae bacterium]